MQLSDLILEWAHSGKTESEALSLAKEKVKIAGYEWTPVKTKLFNDVWTLFEKEKKKVTPIQKLKQGTTTKPAAAVKTAVKPLSPIQKIKPVSLTPVERKQIGKSDLTSANARSAFNSLLVFLVSVVAWRTGKIITPVKQILVNTKPTVTKFLSQIGFEVNDYTVLLDILVGGKKFELSSHAQDVVNLGAALKAIHSNFLERSYNISPEKLTYVKSIAAYLKSSDPTEKALKNIINKVSIVRIPELSSLFSKDIKEFIPKVPTKDMDILYKRYVVLNEKLGGDENFIFPKGRENELRTNPSPEFEDYKDVAKQLNAIYKAQLSSIVINSGAQCVDVEQVKKQMSAAGIKYDPIPPGFEGKIDANCKYYTREGYMLKDQPSRYVKMNPNIGTNYGEYNPKTGKGLYCSFRKSAGGVTNCYTKLHHGGPREEKKQAIVDEFIAKLPTYRPKWLKVIKAGAKDHSIPDYVESVVTEAMYQLAPRPGSREKGNNKKFEDTKGFIYLKKSDVSVVSGKIKFDYSDKNGPQHLVLTNKPGYGQNQLEASLLFGAIESFYNKCPAKDAFLWVTPNGSNLTYNLMNKYLARTMPTFTLHKFRNAKATQMAKDLLDACKLPKGASAAEVNDYFMEVMTKVGEELGHRSKDKPSPTMAYTTYVLKSTSNAFFDEYDVLPIGKVAQHLNAEEASSINVVIRRKK